MTQPHLSEEQHELFLKLMCEEPLSEAEILKCQQAIVRRIRSERRSGNGMIRVLVDQAIAGPTD